MTTQQLIQKADSFNWYEELKREALKMPLETLAEALNLCLSQPLKNRALLLQTLLSVRDENLSYFRTKGLGRCLMDNYPEDFESLRQLSNYGLLDREDLNALIVAMAGTENLRDSPYARLFYDLTVNLKKIPVSETMLLVTTKFRDFDGQKDVISQVFNRLLLNVKDWDDQSGRTAFNAAVEEHSELAEWLLRNYSRYIDIKTHDQFKRTLLHTAAKTGRPGLFLMLLEMVVRLTDEDMKTQHKKDTDEKKTQKLSRKHWLNARDQTAAQTPVLFLVALSPTYAVTFKPLLDHGADPTITDRYGRTVLHYVYEIGQRVAEKQESDKKVEEAKRAAAERLGDLVRLGIPVDCADGSGKTALRLATEAKDIYTMKLLVDLGAKPSAKDSKGLSPEDSVRLSDDMLFVNDVRKHLPQFGLEQSRFTTKSLRKRFKF